MPNTIPFSAGLLECVCVGVYRSSLSSPPSTTNDGRFNDFVLPTPSSSIAAHVIEARLTQHCNASQAYSRAAIQELTAHKSKLGLRNLPRPAVAGPLPHAAARRLLANERQRRTKNIELELQ